MKKQTTGFAALAMLQKILSLACFLIAAGTLSCIRGWIYFILYLIVMAATLAVLLHRDPNALSFPEKNAKKAVGIDITPVSYTHLDVYKRQIKRMPKCS